MDKVNIAIFDFDGTITSKDSMIGLLKFYKGSLYLYFVLFLFAPLLLLMKLGILSNHIVKQYIFSFYFKKMHILDFDTICKAYAFNNRYILRPQALEKINEYVDKGIKVLIVSASVDLWIRPFFDSSFVEIIGTQIEVDHNGAITGHFIGNNCYGVEKKRRISELFKNREEYFIISYGDSRGDMELLKYSDEAHYKSFRQVFKI